MERKGGRFVMGEQNVTSCFGEKAHSPRIFDLIGNSVAATNTDAVKLLERAGVHLLLCNSAQIGRSPPTPVLGRSVEWLLPMIHSERQRVEQWEWSRLARWNFRDLDLIVIDRERLDKVEELFGILYKEWVSGRKASARIYILAPAPAWDLIEDRVRNSPGTYHEYLLWDDGGLWDDVLWNSAKCGRDMLVWLGAGWTSHRHRRFGETANKHAEKMFPPSLEIHISSGLGDLQKEEELLKSLMGQGERPIPPMWRSHLRALCEFLPYHRSPRRNEWLPTTIGHRGGPRPWKGVFDPELNMHLRQLLFEGWLTLWPDIGSGTKKQRYWLHPGSLAVLYWAAREEGKPHTNSPQDFVKGYDWDTGCWFGGRWRKKCQKS